jgi:hypothetical protein
LKTDIMQNDGRATASRHPGPRSKSGINGEQQCLPDQKRHRRRSQMCEAKQRDGTQRHRKKDIHTIKVSSAGFHAQLPKKDWKLCRVLLVYLKEF